MPGFDRCLSKKRSSWYVYDNSELSSYCGWPMGRTEVVNGVLRISARLLPRPLMRRDVMRREFDLDAVERIAEFGRVGRSLGLVFADGTYVRVPATMRGEIEPVIDRPILVQSERRLRRGDTPTC